MTTGVTVSWSDLEDAYLFVSMGLEGENFAYISKATGKIFYVSEVTDVDEDVPDDIEEPDKYWMLPDRHELELDSRVVMDFASESLPGDYNVVRGIFQRRGAYGEFKELLIRRRVVDRWHAYEERRTKEALIAWAKGEGMVVTE